jgi:hypothetical protein
MEGRLKLEKGYLGQSEKLSRGMQTVRLMNSLSRIQTNQLNCGQEHALQFAVALTK